LLEVYVVLATCGFRRVESQIRY